MIDGRRVDVGRGRDASRTSAAHVLQKESLGAGKHPEVIPATLEHGFGVVPVTRAVFDTDDRIRVCLDQSLDQVAGDADLGHRRNVIEVNAQRGTAHAFDDLGKTREQAIVADILVVEGRQHQRARATEVDRVPGQSHCLGQRTEAGAWHHALRIDTRLDQAIEQRHLLVDGQRVCFAVGAEYGEPDVL